MIMGFKMYFAVMSDKIAFFKGNVSADSTLCFLRQYVM